MKTILILAGVVLAIPVLAADSAVEELTAAAKKLAEKPSYTWKTTTVVPESAQFKPGPVEGKTEKDGFTFVSMSFAENLTEAYLKGDQAVITDQDGNWQLASALENQEGPGRFLGRMMRSFKTPGQQAVTLAAALKDVKKEGDVYSGDLTEEGVKAQFRFGEPKNAKGSAKFWVKDGVLAKMETKVTGKIDFNGNEFDADRATTTEIKDVGAAKVNVPEAAKKKFN